MQLQKDPVNIDRVFDYLDKAEIVPAHPFEQGMSNLESTDSIKQASARPGRPTDCLQAVDPLLELFAGFEEGGLLGRYAYNLTALGVAGLTAVALPDGETAETADFDFVAASQRIFDRIEYRVNQHLGNLHVQHAVFLDYSLDKFALGHFRLLRYSFSYCSC
jgi:hypothetical protein